MNKIFFIRHGENQANITKEFSHKNINYSLTEKGILQAKQTAEYFSDKKIDLIYSSPLKRASETAKIISDYINKKYSIIEELREINVGDLENSKPDKKSWNLYFDIILNWKNGNFNKQFPGGENFYQALQRFKIALSKILDNFNNQKILIIGHGGLFSIVIPYLLQKKSKKFSLDSIENCSISELNISQIADEYSIEILSWGYCDHLYGDAKQFISALPTFKN